MRCLSSELPEGERRLLPHAGAAVLECAGQAVDGARIANLPERERGLFADAGTGVFERDDQRIHAGRRTQLSEREGGLIFAADPRTGELVSTWVFVMTLTWSRHQYAEIVTDQKVETWLGCHRRAFEWFGGVVTRVPSATAGDHLRVSFGHGPKQILLLGHFDTVWPIGQLARMPLKRDGGRLYGPGVFDMKAGIGLAMLALRVLGRLELRPSARVVLLFTSDEETGSATGRPVLEAEARRSSTVLVVVGSSVLSVAVPVTTTLTQSPVASSKWETSILTLGLAVIASKRIPGLVRKRSRRPSRTNDIGVTYGLPSRTTPM